jgi:ATP-dependent DNA ligase
LAQQFPALYLVFDLLVDEKPKSLIDEPLADRRPKLEAFAAKYFGDGRPVALSPATRSLEEARNWFRTMGGGLDGIVAKDTTSAYLGGERAGMWKIKNLRTADCVVGGFRYASKGELVGSLLLGLYDEAGALHHVGFTSSMHAVDKPDLTKKLEKLVDPPGFTGRAPGGPSRWSSARSAEWQPLRPELVVEVQYDHYAGGRFRHGTKLLRWRPDKAPAQCTMQQVEREAKSPLGLL